MSQIRMTSPIAITGSAGTPAQTYALTPWVLFPNAVWVTSSNSLTIIGQNANTHFTQVRVPVSYSTNFAVSASFNTTGGSPHSCTPGGPINSGQLGGVFGFDTYIAPYNNSNWPPYGNSRCWWSSPGGMGTSKIDYYAAYADGTQLFISNTGNLTTNTKLSITYDGKYWRWYVDGVEKASFTSSYAQDQDPYNQPYFATHEGSGNGLKNIWYGQLTGNAAVTAVTSSTRLVFTSNVQTGELPPSTIRIR